MRLAVSKLSAIRTGCDIALQLGFNDSSKHSLTFDRSALTRICPGYFLMERIEYMLGLLAIDKVELQIYNSSTEVRIALENGTADATIFPGYINYQRLNATDGENPITFVAPFFQDRACLFQPVDAAENVTFEFDDQFWMSPYNMLCWIIFLVLLGSEQVLFANRRWSNYYGKIINLTFVSSVIYSALVTFIYIHGL